MTERRYLYLITEDEREPDNAGLVEDREKPRLTAQKNVETVTQHRDMETGETWDMSVVSLGYHDFEDEAAVANNMVDVATQNLTEVDSKHPEAAGLNPAEYGA